MTAGAPPTIAGAFRRAALPLGAYYVVTLALPIVNGAAQSGIGFVTHAIVVLVLPLLLIALAHAVHRAAHVVARVGRSVLPSERSRERLRKRATAIEYARPGE
jgi:hypothetical protein